MDTENTEEKKNSERESLLKKLPKEVHNFYKQIKYTGPLVPFQRGQYIVVAARDVDDWMLFLEYNITDKDYRIDKKRRMKESRSTIDIHSTTVYNKFSYALEAYIELIKSLEAAFEKAKTTSTPLYPPLSGIP